MDKQTTTATDTSDLPAYEAAQNLINHAQDLLDKAREDGDQLALMFVCLKGTDQGESTVIEGAAGRSIDDVVPGGPLDLNFSSSILKMVTTADAMKAQFVEALESGDPDGEGCEDPDCPACG